MPPDEPPTTPSGDDRLKGATGTFLFRALVDSMNDAFVVTDRQNAITYANQRFCEMIGYSMDEVQGSDLKRFFDESNWRVVEEQNALRRGGGSSQYELEWIHWTGEKVPTIVSGSPLTDRDGRFIGSFAVITDISGYKKAEQALRQSEEKYRVLFDESPMGIAIISSKGDILSINKAALDIFETTFENLAPELNALTYPPLVNSGLSGDLQRCLSGRVAVVGERRYTSSSGRVSFFRYKMHPRVDNEGTVTEILCAFDDVTEGRRVEERMKQSQEMLRLVTNTIPEFVFWKDKSSVYMGCNTNFAVIAGVARPEAIVGKTDYDLAWTKEQADILVAHDRRVAELNRSEFHIVEPMHYADGRIAWVESSRVPLHGEDGKVIGILCTFQDISDRRQKDDEIRRSESRYKTLAEHSPQGIAILGSNGLAYVNTAFANTVGRPIDDLLKLNLEEVWSLVHPDDRDTLRERTDARIARKPAPTSYEYRLLRPNGEVRWVESYASTIEYGGEPAVQTVTVDVTDRHVAESEVRSAKDRATLYLDLMSHDIRNQMQVILSGAALLRDSFDDETKSSFFDVITHAVQKCSRMIEEVRATEQLIQVPLSAKNLSVSLEKCIDAFAGRSESAKFVTRYDVVDAWVMADEYLELLIMNVLLNAVEHNPKPVKRVWAVLSQEEGSYVITIADNGPGIPDSGKGVLLDKARRFGGLGLHQSNQIAEKYGGRIEVADRIKGDYSQGAEFRIVIPRITKDE